MCPTYKRVATKITSLATSPDRVSGMTFHRFQNIGCAIVTAHTEP